MYITTIVHMIPNISVRSFLLRYRYIYHITPYCDMAKNKFPNLFSKILSDKHHAEYFVVQ